MPKSVEILELSFYFMMSCVYLGTVYYDSLTPSKLEKVNITFHLTFGGRAKFLTFINMVGI